MKARRSGIFGPGGSLGRQGIDGIEDWELVSIVTVAVAGVLPLTVTGFGETRHLEAAIESLQLNATEPLNPLEPERVSV